MNNKLTSGKVRVLHAHHIAFMRIDRRDDGKRGRREVHYSGSGRVLESFQGVMRHIQFNNYVEKRISYVFSCSKNRT